MLIDLGQDAIDLGIVVTDGDASLAFYRDLLGMDHEASIPMPLGGGGTMHRLRCGTTLIKIVALDEPPTASPPPGGIVGGTGFRYFSIHANNVAEVMQACEAAGVAIVMPVTEARPGVTVAMVNDPDGNVVEFVHYA
jgi:catechol 2,3-dioxygenase-like lactoylglutathione lyase family enzyme